MLRKIGVISLQHYKIIGCHRHKKTSRDKPAKVIVPFTNRKRAYQSLENCRYLKDCVPEFRNLYIVENLCPRFKEIFDECYKLKNEGKIKYVWSYDLWTYGVVVSMFDFHRIAQGSNPGRGGKIS